MTKMMESDLLMQLSIFQHLIAALLDSVYGTPGCGGTVLIEIIELCRVVKWLHSSCEIVLICCSQMRLS